MPNKSDTTIDVLNHYESNNSADPVDAPLNVLACYVRETEIGTRIPSTQALCEKFNAPVRRVVKTLAKLEKEGWVEFTSPRIRVVSRPGMRLSAESAKASAKTPSQRICALLLPWAQGEFPVYPTSIRAHYIWNLVGELSRHNLAPQMISALTDPENLAALLAGTDGVVAFPVPVEGDETMLETGKWEKPVVVLGDRMTRSRIDAFAGDIVFTDHRSAARRLAMKLAARGCRRLLPVVTDNYYDGNAGNEWWVEERLAGYADGAREAGVELMPAAVLPYFDEHIDTESQLNQAARQAVGFLLDKVGNGKADGLLVLADVVAGYVARACRMLGVEPGRDVRLAGYDNNYGRLPLAAWEPEAPGFSVDQGYRDVAGVMVELLCDRLRGGLSEAPKRRTVEPRVVELP